MRPLLALALVAGMVMPALAIELPPAGGGYDSQLGGAYPPGDGVTIVSRDREEAPAPGLYNICYVNAFQTQPQETAWWRTTHPELLLPQEDPNWPGEFLFDTSTPAKRAALAQIVGGWIEGCAKSGYDAIEADNLDSYARSNGQLTLDDNLDLARELTAIAHRAGLAFAQKNAAELLERQPGFDFAIVEGCEVYDECESYTEIYGRHVLEIEYSDTARSNFDNACAARATSISILLRDRQLTPAGRPGHIYERC